MDKQLYWVYVLHCDNDTYYTGYTSNITRRYQQHMNGKSKYTRSFKPLSIAACWQVTADKSTAMKIESFIKKLLRKQKINLISNPENLTELFQCANFVNSINTK